MLDRECAGHVASPRRGVLVALRWGAAAPSQTIGRDRRTTGFGDRMRQYRGLVVTPGEKSRPMERHWQLEIGLGQYLLAGAPHPLRQRRCKMEPVAVLQRENQRTAGVVVAHRRPRAIEARRVGHAPGAEPVGADVEIEGITTLGTAGRAKEGHGAPTFCAQRAGRRDRHAAAEAARRQQQIEQTVARAAQPGGRGKRRHRSIVAPCRVTEQDPRAI